MVSALASSSVTFSRNVSVKVLVSDWDLLCSRENSHLISERRKEFRCEENPIITKVTFNQMPRLQVSFQPKVDVSRSVSPKIEKEVNFGVTSNFDPLGLPTETQLHCVWE